MGPVFAVDHQKLDSNYRDLGKRLAALGPIHSTETFNHYCQAACNIWREQFPNGIGATSPRFDELHRKIVSGDGLIIRTSWGGVVVTVHQPPRIEKFLVIRQGGYLALEKHDQKDEHLETGEGAGLILWRSSPEQPLTAEVLTPGKRLHFEPGMEHCIIGTEDLLVLERSTDPKGMDQDLIFIYQPEAK